ncbi:hypothetical protein CSUI_004466 [Cystoisospora suis]|uniref:Uncharacterized protein n=1 Tax=Cystoisospora suis TaxID=483139 RepID=A0A2C6L1K9_9APIC|nr:hypothetical protein CSUI_004466 [Cystoisospora suis]
MSGPAPKARLLPELHLPFCSPRVLTASPSPLCHSPAATHRKTSNWVKTFGSIIRSRRPAVEKPKGFPLMSSRRVLFRSALSVQRRIASLLSRSLVVVHLLSPGVEPVPRSVVRSLSLHVVVKNNNTPCRRPTLHATTSQGPQALVRWSGRSR